MKRCLLIETRRSPHRSRIRENSAGTAAATEFSRIQLRGQKCLLIAAVFGMLAALCGLPGGTSTAADNDKDWGTVKGRIVWGGDTLPEPAELKVTQDEKHCLEKGKLFSEEWVVDKDSKGVKWVFVWLAGEPDPDKKVEKKLPIHPSLKDIKEKEVSLDQPCCQFIPHALAMREGQTLIAKNSSPVGHNVNYTGHPFRNPGKNVSLPAKGSLPIEGLKADDKFPISVACNIHGWMKAYVRVFDHPYFAVTDKDGNFEIKNAPAGDWRLKIWHETGWRGGAAGRDGEKVTIKGGGTTDVGKLDMKPQ
jgi:hypothetical protein